MSSTDIQIQTPDPLQHGPEDEAIHSGSIEASEGCEPVLAEGTEDNTPALHVGVVGNQGITHAKFPLNNDQTGALKIHNDGRHTKGLAPLQWDSTLQAHAQQWANGLAQIGKMQHSTSDTRKGEGENLAWAWASNGVQNPMTGGAKGWMDESKKYHGESVGQGNLGGYGHYTQCMWRSTTHVGIACAKDAKGGWYTVGRYSPPGNRTGQKPY